MESKINEPRAHVAISQTAATQLDLLVARSLQCGHRPAGRRACRASMIEELADLALKAISESVTPVANATLTACNTDDDR